jgi:hypothetical protein
MAALLGKLRLGPDSTASMGQRVLRVVTVLVLATIIVVVGVLVTSWARSDNVTSARLIRQRANFAVNQFGLFFRPVVATLELIRIRGRQGVLKPEDAENVHMILAPLLERIEHVASATVTLPDGGLVELRRTADVWDLRTVSTSVRGDAPPAWRAGAAALESEGGIYWSDLGETAQDEDLAVAAAVAWTAGEGGIYAAALAIPHREIVSFVSGLDLGGEGTLAVVGDADRLTRFSGALPDRFEEVALSGFLAGLSAADKESADLAADVRGLVAGQGLPEPRSFGPRDARQWIAFSRVSFGARETRLAVTMSEQELLAEILVDQRVRVQVLLVLVVLLLASVGTLLMLAHAFRRRVQAGSAGPAHAAASEGALAALIREGEHERLEFKSSIRWNLKADRADKAVSLAWLKAVAAFLNTRGGTLLVGVQDDGTLLGLDADKFANEDKFQLHFNNLINQHLGAQNAGLIKSAIRSVGTARILVVDCAPSRSPVFLKDGENEAFFVRVGPASRQLPISKVLEYMQKR